MRMRHWSHLSEPHHGAVWCRQTVCALWSWHMSCQHLPKLAWSNIFMREIHLYVLCKAISGRINLYCTILVSHTDCDPSTMPTSSLDHTFVWNQLHTSISVFQHLRLSNWWWLYFVVSNPQHPCQPAKKRHSAIPWHSRQMQLSYAKQVKQRSRESVKLAQHYCWTESYHWKTHFWAWKRTCQ